MRDGEKVDFIRDSWRAVGADFDSVIHFRFLFIEIWSQSPGTDRLIDGKYRRVIDSASYGREA